MARRDQRGAGPGAHRSGTPQHPIPPQRAPAAPERTPAAQTSVTEDLDRARLGHALRSAWLLPSGAATAGGLPAEIRTLGLGQVLALLLRKDPGRLSPLLASWLAKARPALTLPPGAREMDAGSALAAWVALEDRHRAAVVEANAIAWAVDLKLMTRIVDASRQPTLAPQEDAEADAAAPPAAPPTDPRWEDRRAAAAVAAFGLEPCATRAQSLPFEIQQHGLLRTLAILARDTRQPPGSAPRGVDSTRLAASLRSRVAGMPRAGVPSSLTELADLLVDPARAPLARAVEAEALAWAVELKSYVSALSKVSP